MFDASAKRMGLRHALTEMFQEAMPALQNALHEFLLTNARNNFHGGQPSAGMSDVRTQSVNVISEHLATFAPARDTHVKLLLMDGGQRS